MGINLNAFEDIYVGNIFKKDYQLFKIFSKSNIVKYYYNYKVQYYNIDIKVMSFSTGSVIYAKHFSHFLSELCTAIRGLLCPYDIILIIRN